MVSEEGVQREEEEEREEKEVEKARKKVWQERVGEFSLYVNRTAV